MASACPKCKKPVEADVDACPACGYDLTRASSAAMAAARPRSDSQQYGIIIGSMVLIAVVILIGASLMNTTKPCKDCKTKGIVVCENCKDGKPKCLECKGAGTDPQTFSTCMKCNGTGVSAGLCPKCKGAGKHPCKACGGSGYRPGGPGE
jgi:hypothetical protein